MSEKEFLIKFLEYVHSQYSSTQVALSFSNALVDEFLEQHRKEFYEVEFHEKIEEDKQFDRDWKKEFGSVEDRFRKGGFWYE